MMHRWTWCQAQVRYVCLLMTATTTLTDRAACAGHFPFLESPSVFWEKFYAQLQEYRCTAK